MSDPHAFFMKRAIFLAAKGKGKTFPNPCVGAVVVKNGRIIGEGWHKKAGLPHAEINALETCRMAGFNPRGATLYVTLSPCCHFGKTPPCTSEILRSGISEVFSACLDPNPLTSHTLRIFKKNGIAHHVGLLEKKALALNVPYVTVKIAMSLNGKISGQKGRYITCKKSLMEVQKLRAEHDAVLIGAGTVLSDDPHLGVRYVSGKDPLRVILDSRLRIPFLSTVLRDEHVLIFTTDSADRRKIQQVQKSGAEIIVSHKKMSLLKILAELYRRGVSNLLVEGGQTIFTAFLKEKLADRVVFFLAPKIISRGKYFIAEPLPLDFTFLRVEKIGEDIFSELTCTAEPVSRDA
ncbi:bifunctional diaminohydroxyphosphoribosylaminopyrimidine deaminase/5-amino-6-(5-phosphoribosylamino)uracil reductase RibD [Candidatus Peregrinibacteria bacterium]|nr:bifunctional diaminohydroxyphosphoribosylaminopyrimidine deaminase/5-amino-6-(5-phosphoribosylamino)uracil reductase RibD [Candidatus Peregrinibacteria bacterium]